MFGNSNGARGHRPGWVAMTRASSMLLVYAVGGWSGVAQAQSAAPTPPSPQTAASAPARDADTIGEAADRQRTQRMLQSQGKAGPAAADARVPAIVVERAAERAAAASPVAAKPAEPPMVLTEVMRGPTKLLAGIELNGVNRFVTVGEDIGNGWRVVAIDKFKVVLAMPVPEKPSAKPNPKAKPGKAADLAGAEPAGQRTLVLALGMRQVAAPAPANAPAPAVAH